MLPALERRPDIPGRLVESWRAFNALSRSRPMVATASGAVLPRGILVSEILAYCTMFGVDDPDDRDDFVACITALDDEYLAFESERMAANQ